MKSAIFLLLGVVLIAVAAPPQSNPDERIVTHSPAHSPRQQKAEAAPARPAAAVDRQEADAMRKDLEQMRVLLNQMRTNLAFVQTSDTPLKHEFDLNNQMWQLLLNDMDRRLQKMAAPAQR